MKHPCFRTLVICLAALTGSLAAQPFVPGHAEFAVTVNDLVSPYRVMTFSILPGDSLEVRIDGAKPIGEYAAHVSSGDLRSLSPQAWRWKAPSEHGRVEMKIYRSAPTPDSIKLNLLVMVPASAVKKGMLNGYRIGQYPKKPYKGLPQYLPPTGFIELPDSTFDFPVSPHFTLRQFVCKQDGGYPKYLLLRPELLLKLELVLQQVNDRGYPCQSFHVMSGFRTPHYNKAIGNVKYSRHQWGGAADIFIDEQPVDGMMDDLTGDGRTDWRDAAVLYDIIDDLHEQSWYMPYVGGLGRYRKTDNHGPFVHIDVRGFLARWGE